jgi:outer membrane protein assembly factor BamB
MYLGIRIGAAPYVEYLYSLSAQTGQLQWKYQVTRGIGWGITVAGNLVYFANGTYLDALRVSDGQRVWRYGTAPYYSAKKGECYDSSEFGAPAIADGVLLVKSTGNCSREAVNAINPATGALYWQIALESSTLSDLLLVTDDSAL